MPQKHDQGWKKRQPVAQTEPPASPEHLARELVENGLATPQILDPRANYGRRKETTP